MKGLIALIFFAALSIGLVVLFNDVGGAIETRAATQARAHTMRIEQKAKEFALKNKEAEATSDERVALKETLWEVGRYVAPIALMIMIGITLHLYNGWTRAEIKKADFQATQIHMDPTTNTYPIRVFEAGGKLRIHNPNTGQTLALDMNHEAVPMLVAGSTATQLQRLTSGDQIVNPASILGIIEG